MQNESTGFSESLRAVEPGRRRSRKLGPVDTAGGPLINVGVAEDFLLSPASLQ
jgi:hypothetical protein